MTTPDTKMLSAERLADLVLTSRMLRKQAVELWPDVNESGQVHFGRAIMESAAESIDAALPDIDALTARVAELEQQVSHWQAVHETAATSNEALRSELAAARAPVEEGEIADLVANLNRDVIEQQAAQAITRLARERDEAPDRALEEAAKIADEHVARAKRRSSPDFDSAYIEAWQATAGQIAAAIRAHKSKGGA